MSNGESQSIPMWQRFEILVVKILELNNYVVRSHTPRGDEGFDLLGLLGNEPWAIEVKYYRTARAQLSLIETAASRVVDQGHSGKAAKGMLVVSCVIPASMRESLEERFGIVFVDRFELRSWTRSSSELSDELDAIVEADPSTWGEETPRGRDVKNFAKSLHEVVRRQVDTTGTKLCDELRAVPRGKSGWSKYEKVCEQILKYLFPRDLLGWHRQKNTDDGLNKFDLVCRISPTTEFWKFLIDHLNSRYALFEFKNYSKKIQQGQILTTEKYLLERGLRRVAIVFSRLGAEINAHKMAQGAMRESGKLMLVIDDHEVCRMLHMKERGEDPTDRLFEIADDFLLSLPR